VHFHYHRKLNFSPFYFFFWFGGYDKKKWFYGLKKLKEKLNQNKVQSSSVFV